MGPACRIAAPARSAIANGPTRDQTPQTSVPSPSPTDPPVPLPRSRLPRRAASFVVATLALLSFGSGSAAASPAGTGAAADPKAAAKARFERAVRLFEDGNYEAALVEFRTSIGDYPTRTAAVNITICFRKLGRYDEEKDALDELERSFPTTKRSEIESLARARAEVADLLGTVAFSNLPAGTSITIDGRERGETPLAAPIAVSAGIRTLRATKRGFRPFERRIDVPARKDVVVSASLEAEPTTPVLVTTVAPTRPAVPPSPRAPLWPAVALAAGGVVAGGVGVVFLSSRESAVSDAKSLGCAPNLTSASLFAQCQSLENRSSSRGTLSAVFLAGGGALLAGGVIYWMARGGKEPETATAVRCAPSASSAGVSFGCMGAF